MQYISQAQGGKLIDPGDGIVPILKEYCRNKLRVIGTGFYLTRYGLFITAYHVLEDLIDRQDRPAYRGFVVHLEEEDKIIFRQIIGFNRLPGADFAIGQANNYVDKYPENPLMNLMPKLTTEIPPIGSRLVTYAYPENEMIDFADRPSEANIIGGYYDGEFRRYVQSVENPSMPCPYYETTIEIRSGASGGPVFDMKGRIIGINCRGWDFRGSEFESDPLSYVVPISQALAMQIALPQLPEISGEFRQIPKERRGIPLQLKELAQYGHIFFDPPLE